MGVSWATGLPSPPCPCTCPTLTSPHLGLPSLHHLRGLYRPFGIQMSDRGPGRGSHRASGTHQLHCVQSDLCLWPNSAEPQVCASLLWTQGVSGPQPLGVTGGVGTLRPWLGPTKCFPAGRARLTPPGAKDSPPHTPLNNAEVMADGRPTPKNRV